MKIERSLFKFNVAKLNDDSTSIAVHSLLKQGAPEDFEEIIMKFFW